MSVTVDDLFANLDPIERDRRTTGHLMHALVDDAELFGQSFTKPADGWDAVLVGCDDATLETSSSPLSRHILQKSTSAAASILKSHLPADCRSFALLRPVKAISAGDYRDTGVEFLLAAIEARTCGRRGFALVKRNAAGVRTSAGWGPLTRLPLPAKSLGIPLIENLRRKLWGPTDPQLLWLVSDDPKPQR